MIRVLNTLSFGVKFALLDAGCGALEGPWKPVGWAPGSWKRWKSDAFRPLMHSQQDPHKNSPLFRCSCRA